MVLFDPWIRERFFLDPGFQNQDPNHISESLITIFWVKKYHTSCSTGCFCTCSSLKKFFPPPLLVLLLDGSGIRDPGWIKIRIPDEHPGYSTLLENTFNKEKKEKKSTNQPKISKRTCLEKLKGPGQ